MLYCFLVLEEELPSCTKDNRTLFVLTAGLSLELKKNDMHGIIELGVPFNKQTKLKTAEQLQTNSDRSA